MDDLTMEIVDCSVDAPSILLIRVTGLLPVGSAGNTIVNDVKQRLMQMVAARATFGEAIHGLVLDFSGLNYVFGDAIGSLWIRPMAHGIKCVIVATGATKAALESLIVHSIPISIVERLNEAFQLLNTVRGAIGEEGI